VGQGEAGSRAQADPLPERAAERARRFV